jgi:hypothetical protein
MNEERQVEETIKSSGYKKGDLMHKGSKMVTILLLIIIVFSFSGCSDTTTNNPSANNDQVEQKQDYKVGDKFVVGYFNYFLQKVEQKSSVGNQFMSYKAGGVYEICYLSAVNGNNQPRYIDRNMFSVIDDQNRSYSVSSEATTAYVMEYNSQYDFFLKQANPGVQVDGLLVFDIPKDAKGLKLEVSGGFGSSEKAYIKLD